MDDSSKREKNEEEAKETDTDPGEGELTRGEDCVGWNDRWREHRESTENCRRERLTPEARMTRLGRVSSRGRM